MMFFGDELVRVRHNESHSDVWLNKTQARSQCAERLSTSNYMEYDIGASESGKNEKPSSHHL
jgi:hypothetical protein